MTDQTPAPRVVRVLLAARPDPEIEVRRILDEARRIFESGAGETSDMEVLSAVADLCGEAGCEIDAVRPETHKDGSYHEIHFSLREVAIALEGDIEIRPAPYYQPPTSPQMESSGLADHPQK